MLAVKELFQHLSDSLWLNILCRASFCSSFFLNSFARSLIGLTVLLTHIVESAARTDDGGDGGDVHIQTFA